jgi:glycosyltransferase involved in cell wall biosynthesis
MRVAFVTNFAAHYRVKTFETLARYFDVKYLFFSGGNEWYWQKQHGTRTGDFDYEYLRGVEIAGTRITPGLVPRLLFGGYDVVLKCINGRFAVPAAYFCARICHRPFVLWTGIWSTLDTPFHRAADFLARYLYRHADAVVVYGEHVKRFLLERGVDEERVFVAAHAVDNDSYSKPVPADEVAAVRRRLALPEEGRVVLFLGRLECVKGLGYLLEAFAVQTTPNTYLVLAGTGREKDALQRQAGLLGLGNKVRFAGYVPVETARAYYAAADVLVLPSITVADGKELWGLVVNEAFNQGLPVIATDAVGAAAGGLVRDGINGYVVPERDASELAKAISKITADRELRARFSSAARTAIRNWDNELMVKGFRNAIEFAYRTRMEKSADDTHERRELHHNKLG